MPTTAEGGELPYAGTPEMDALFAQINTNPQMLQVVGQNPELLAEVMKHAGLDTNAQELIDMTAEWPDEVAEDAIQASAPANDPMHEAPQANYDDEEDTTIEEPSAEGDEPIEPSDESQPDVLEASAMPRGQPPMPPGMQAPPQAQAQGGNPIDDLISAQMMQLLLATLMHLCRQGMQAGRQQRPAIPQSRQPSSG